MNYFNQILGGSVPLCVVESIGGLQNDIRSNHLVNHLQLNKSNDSQNIPRGVASLMTSPYGKYVKMGLALNRSKVINGIHTMLSNANTSNNINTFTKSIVDLLNTVSPHTQQLLLNIVHLTGITNKPINELANIEKKLMLTLELRKNIKPTKPIDIVKLYSKRDHDFVNKLTTQFVVVFEQILNNIMNNIKVDKMCSFYAFSVEVSNGFANYTQIIEEFGVSIDNSKVNIDSTKITNIQDIEKKIDQSKVIKGMTSMLSNAITKATSTNKGDLIRALSVSNKLTIANAKSSNGGFILSGVTQSITVSSEAGTTFVQSVQNKIINDISSSIKEQISLIEKTNSSSITKLAVDESIGTSIGDVLVGLAGIVGQTVGKVADAAVDLLGVNVGNKVENRTEKEITQELKSKFSLNQNFQYQKNDDVKNIIENIFSSDNLAKCANNSNFNNDVELGSIDVAGPINISNIKQEAIVTDVVKCMFNQTTLNDISTKIMSSFDNLIQQLMENVDITLDDTQKKQITGDIYAVGVAGSAVVSAAGDAVSTAAQGVGSGISSALSGLALPFIALGALILLLIIGYAIYKIASKDSGSNDYESDE
jgi:hypothetical protein